MISQIIATLLLSNFLILTSAFIFNPIVGDLAQQFSMPVGATGSLIWAYWLGLTLTTPLTSYFLKKWDFKSVLQFGLCGVVLSSFAIAVSDHFLIFLFSRFITGISAGLVVPASWAWVFECCPTDKRKSAVAYLSLDLMLAYTLGMPLGLLSVKKWGVSGTFSGLAVVATLCVLALIRMKKTAVLQNEKRTLLQYLKEFFSFWNNPVSKSYLFIIFMWSAAYHGVFSFIGAWIDHVQFKTAAITAMGIGATIGCLLASKVGKSIVLITATVLSILFIIFAQLNYHNAGTMVLALCLWFLVDRLAFVHLFSKLDRAAPQNAGVFSTLVLFVLFLASTIGTAAVGEVLDYTYSNWIAIPAFYATLVFICLIFPMRILIRKKIF